MVCKNLKSYICAGLLLSVSTLFSQQTTKNVPVSHKVLLIPFEANMFMDGIGKAVNTTTNLSAKKITEAFRYRMDLALYTTFKQSYPTISLIQAPKQGDTTLLYTYGSIGYNYELLSGADSSGESHAEFDPKLQKTHFVRNGQLQVPMDYSSRFMNVHIENSQLLPYLNKKYDADIFVFINELDIKDVPNNTTQDLSESNYRRLVTVHYSILNMQKHYLAKGILTTYFPYMENDPKMIGEKYFSTIAHNIVEELTKGLQKKQTGHSH